jgi:hypothetical protein
MTITLTLGVNAVYTVCLAPCPACSASAPADAID